MISSELLTKSVQDVVFVLVVGLVGLAFTPAFAEIRIQPSLYEMTGKDLQITYTTSNEDGEAQLDYHRFRKHLTFKGDEIRVQRTELGRLVTVTTRQVPDLKTETVSVLIPDINLEDTAAVFTTFAITTTHLTTIAGPDLVAGQVQSYRPKRLTGKASYDPTSIRPNLSGVVTFSPTCPGPQRIDHNCEQPYVGALVQLNDAFDNILATATTDQSGLFDMLVAPGEYIIRIAPIRIIPEPIPEPIPVPAPLPTPLPPREVAPVTEVLADDDASLIRFPACPETAVSVPDQGSVFVRIRCDTGIR